MEGERDLAERRIVAEGVVIRVTASLGLAFAPADRRFSVSALITTADRCLYQAKHGGRNRVVFRHATPAIALSSQSTKAD